MSGLRYRHIASALILCLVLLLLSVWLLAWQPLDVRAANNTWARVNIDHDWVGVNYAAGHTISVTVKSGDGITKAFGTFATDDLGGWGDAGGESGDNWQPERPDIQPGDIVEFASDDGWQHAIVTGDVMADVDVDADQVTGTIHADFGDSELGIECHPWGAWDAGIHTADVKSSAAKADGSSQYLCEWDPAAEWDVQGGQAIAVMYLEPDEDRVIRVFQGPAPDLFIHKWAEAVPVSGRLFAWYLSFGNSGDMAAEEVTVVDTLPDGVTFIGESTGLATVQGSEVHWDLDTFAPQTEMVVTMIVRVNAPPDTLLENHVRIETVTPEPNMDNNEAGDGRHVVPDEVDLQVHKGARPGDPVPGKDFLYDIGYCNHLPASARDVVVTETLPDDVQFIREWHRQGWSVDTSQPGIIQWSIDEFPGGACDYFEILVRLDQNAPREEPIRNQVEIGSATKDVAPENNVAEHEVWANDQERVNLFARKSYGHGSPIAGEEYTFWIRVWNEGNVATTSTVLSDVLPSGTSYVSARRFDWNEVTGEYDVVTPVMPGHQQGDVVVFDLGDVVPWRWIGFEITVQIDNTVPPGSVLTNTVQVNAAEEDEDPAQNEFAFVFATQGPGPNLKVHKWVEGDVCPGCEFSYGVEFFNDGNEPALDVRVKDFLPANVDYLGNDAWEDPNTENGALVWDLGTVLPGEVHGTRIHVSLPSSEPAGIELTNLVQVETSSTESRLDDNEAIAMAIAGPDLVVEKHICEDRPAPSWEFTYCIEVWNQGGATAMNAAMVDLLPQGVTYVGDWWDGTAENGLVTWHLGEIPPGWSENLQLRVRMEPDVTIGSQILNVIEITSENPDADPSNNTFSLDTEVVSPLAVRVQESHNWVEGRAVADHEVIVTLKDAGGTVKSSQTVMADGDGFFHAGELHENIQPGDLVAVDVGIEAIEIEVVKIEATVMLDTDEVAGTVYSTTYPADVLAEFWFPDGPPPVEGQTDGSGDFVIQPAGFDLQLGHVVAIWYLRPDGHQIGIVRQALQVVVTQMPEEHIDIGTEANTMVSVQLLDKNDGLKFEAEEMTSQDGYLHFDLKALTPPIDITSEDRVIVSNGTYTTIVPIPRMLPMVDEPSDRLVAITTFPQDTQIYARLWRADQSGEWWRPFQSGVSGFAVVDFSQEGIDLGDQGSLLWQLPSGQMVWSHNKAMITAVNPNLIEGVGSATDIDIWGLGFVPKPKAFLWKGVVPIAPLLSVQIIDDTHMQAKVPAGLPPGLYNLVLFNPDGYIGWLTGGLEIGGLKQYLPLIWK